MACTQCGAATVWDDSVSSVVCTGCGSLTDPSQSILTSAQYAPRDDIEASLWEPTPTTLKSVRSGNNWDLAGQGKESRDRKNAFAMSEFVKSLAVSLNAPGLSPRAITLFNQMRTATHFRWGAKSRAVAAASLAIALRESNRPDALRDLAAILQVPPTSVSREFTSITSTLGLSLTLVDPSVHIPALQAHLSSVLMEHQKGSSLPASIVKALQPLPLHSVANTATSLCRLLARLSPGHDVLRLPVPPTACALFLLALEAEARAALNPLGDLAQCLGQRCSAAKSVVMGRYKVLQDEIALWVKDVPWLDKYESKNGRAKVAKRLVVARGIKDVVQFQQEVWEKRAKPKLELDASDEEQDTREGLPKPLDSPEPRKHPKLNNALTHVTRFLLDPLNTPLSSPSPRLEPPSSSNHLQPTPPSTLSLATYILTNPSSSRMPMPTRLQLLTLDRGGASASQIPDDDLFAPGELEGLVRNADEVQVLRTVFGWDSDEVGGEEQVDAAKHDAKRKRKRKRKDAEANASGAQEEETSPQRRKKSRLNLQALQQFLAGDHGESTRVEGSADDLDMENNSYLLGLDEVVTYSDDEDHDEDGHEHSNDQAQRLALSSTPSPRRNCQRQGTTIDANTTDTNTSYITYTEGGEGESEILETWRPPTPDGGCGEGRYEEEYD